VREGDLLGRRVLDVGCGTGRLAAALDERGARVWAVEPSPEMAALARERFANVKIAPAERLPFKDGWFDRAVMWLVLHLVDRPRALAEVARILAPGGTFLTQQVDGRSLEDLMAVFGAQPQWPNATLQTFLPQLTAAGLTIANAQEWSGRSSFADVGAIVCYLKHVPWLVPDFSVDRYAEQLHELQRRLDRGQPLAFVARQYLIEARKVIETL